MNWFKKKSANKVFKDTWLNNALEQHSKHQSDTFKLLEEVERLQRESLIPNCFKTATSEYFNIRTILGQYAHSYIDMLKQSEKEPEMTLKEYLEL